MRQPPNGIALTAEEAFVVAKRIGYPVLVRPSYVLGGRAMEIVYSDEMLQKYMTQAAEVAPEKPILIDKFLEDAIEVDVDAVADGERCVIGGIMEQLELAGVHSGDSSCVIPPYSLSDPILRELSLLTRKVAQEIGVRGLMNVQWAVKDGDIYVIEVNPRASRTVPFISKAVGVPLAKIAAKVMAGMTLEEAGYVRELEPKHTAVKHPVFPFSKFPRLRHHSRSGDAFDRRVDRNRSPHRPGLRKSLRSDGASSPFEGPRVHLGQGW